MIKTLFLMAAAAGKLIVMSPPDLKEMFPNGEVKSQMANFGHIPYG